MIAIRKLYLTAGWKVRNRTCQSEPSTWARKMPLVGGCSSTWNSIGSSIHPMVSKLEAAVCANLCLWTGEVFKFWGRFRVPGTMFWLTLWDSSIEDLTIKLSYIVVCRWCRQQEWWQRRDSDDDDDDDDDVGAGAGASTCRSGGGGGRGGSEGWEVLKFAESSMCMVFQTITILVVFSNSDGHPCAYMCVRREPDVCPEHVSSRTKRLFFFTDPQEVCEGLLPQIIAKRAMKQIACRMRGEGPHLVYRPSLQGRLNCGWNTC